MFSVGLGFWSPHECISSEVVRPQGLWLVTGREGLGAKCLGLMENLPWAVELQPTMNCVTGSSTQSHGPSGG